MFNISKKSRRNEKFYKKIDPKSQVGDFIILPRGKAFPELGEKLDDYIYISSKTKTQERWAVDNNMNVKWLHKVNFGICEGDVKKMAEKGYKAYCINHATENLSALIKWLIDECN